VTAVAGRRAAGRRGASDDLACLAVWGASRVAVALLAVGGAWLLSGAQASGVEGFLQRWDRWDVGLFRKVAEFGYTGYPQDYPDRGVEAFFPGAPLVLRLVHAVVPDWTAAGLLVSLLAGALASVALGRLARLEGASAPTAVTCLVLLPYAVFLFAGYSEALFLALALWGWLQARQERWMAAGLLVAGASTVRISGLFLGCGLVVHYLVLHRGRVRADAVVLLAPFVAVAAYFGYLWALTGDPLRWFAAQELGWGRRTTPPWEALRATVAAARAPEQPAEYAWSFAAEIVAVAVGVALVVVLLVRRSWGEATYVGLSVAALATSTYYLSVGRATLLWWPLFVLVALAAGRRPWVLPSYVAVCAPLMALLVLTFTSGRWVG
jgi:Mannosyltransferase (PIG-V)